jgi:hypothetical protein
MNEESAHLTPGGSKSGQWYKNDPHRFAEETALIEAAYPGFEIGYEENGNVFWEGFVNFTRTDGSIVSRLKVKIECKPRYPEVFPTVHDVEKILAQKNCPHVYGDTKDICYGTRLDPQLDFVGLTRIRDLIDYVSAFLGKQWYYEKYGMWPGGHAHGVQAFLDHEITKGPIDPNGPCPCGHNTLTYAKCDQPYVRGLLNQLNDKLPKKIRDQLPVPKRNDDCVCGSKKKFKRCCFDHITYPASRVFLMAKFPEWTKAAIETLKGRNI